MNPRAWLPRLFPMLRWWHLVTRENLPRDLLAGLVGALIVLPQGIAFATLAGRKAVVVTPSAKYAVAGTLMRVTPSALTRRMRSMRSR